MKAEEQRVRPARKWWLLGMAAAMVIGLAVGVGVGVGLRPQAGGGGGALLAEAADSGSGGVPRRQLAARATRGRPSIVVVGDGLTESSFSFKLAGWGSQLVGAYIRKADVINRGFGGYFTNWFKDYMLDSLFNVTAPLMGIVFLGTKDSQLSWAAGNAYTPPERFGANVDAIIGAGRAAGVKHWLIISPPPVYEAPGKAGARTSANTRLYVEQLAALAKKHGAAFLDIFSGWPATPGWSDKYLNSDKLHLSAEGNARLFQDVMSTIKAKLPEMDPAAMAWNFPPMDAVDKENPAAAFAALERRRARRQLRLRRHRL